MSTNAIIEKEIKDIVGTVDNNLYQEISLVQWRVLLAKECNVYVFNEAYLAKRFDEINYKFCAKNEAREILIDNLYALLRFKYFKKATEETDKRIREIVDSFSQNLKTTLEKVSFNKDSSCKIVKMLNNSCIAFRNGVYDFKNNTWLFKYIKIEIESLKNTLYLYDDSYIILWYIDIDFEPLDIDINKLSLEDFIEFMKEYTKVDRNYCFELMYNMSHDLEHQFSLKMFTHLCEILGYTLLQDFSQNFVLFVGSGQNGKNSLFDGCFTGRVIPRPAANDLDSIENDRFITGSLQNKAHNIFLESSAKTYTESKMLKAITGSMYQTIEEKGVDKYSGLINCKYIFAANDQDKIKFSDTTVGFKRRINLFEIYYKWDKFNKYLKRGDYYNTKFNDNLDEIKNNIGNTVIFIYFAMYGILRGTSNFSKNFEFSYNDYKLSYSEIDVDLKDKLDNVFVKNIINYIESSSSHYEECKSLFYDTKKNRLYNSLSLRDFKVKTYSDLIKLLKNEEDFLSYFGENDVYINLRILQKIIKDLTPSINFTSTVKKIYNINSLLSLYNNQPYVKCCFIGFKLFLKK